MHNYIHCVIRVNAVPGREPQRVAFCGVGVASAWPLEAAVLSAQLLSASGSARCSPTSFNRTRASSTRTSLASLQRGRQALGPSRPLRRARVAYGHPAVIGTRSAQQSRAPPQEAGEMGSMVVRLLGEAKREVDGIPNLSTSEPGLILTLWCMYEI